MLCLVTAAVRDTIGMSTVRVIEHAGRVAVVIEVVLQEVTEVVMHAHRQQDAHMVSN